ncbi:MAG: PHP domain-containing protein [Anaerolineae bacterium]|nr:PHP domain-containing protein [Anaerolineae bacterium]
METQLTGRADLHMHTNLSDGLATPEALLNYVARRKHLDVIAITDHDVLDGSLWAYEQRELYPFDIIPGVEVTAREGHVLALWVTRPIPKGLSVRETVDAIHAQNGVAVLAHPGEIMIAGRHLLRYLQQPEVLLTWGIDAIEIYNAGTMTPGNNILAQRIARHLPLPRLGNSDAHTLNAIGRSRTRFPGYTAADLRAALAQGVTKVEGKRWLITDYLRLSPSSVHRSLSGSLRMNN